MNLKLVLIMLMMGFVGVIGFVNAQSEQRQATEQVDRVLNDLHDAASKADGERYFSLFAPDAVFLGTDATERWPIDEFKIYAMKRFETGTGWTYSLTPGSRHIVVHGDMAWFDELLENAKYGTCRGSGVLRRIEGAWKIAQYNLAFAIPNESAPDVVNVIKGDASQATTVYLVRHTEKDNADPRNPNPNLSDAGRARAAALAKTLADVTFDHIVVSQMKRTQQTVEGIGSRAGRMQVVDAAAVDAVAKSLQNEWRGKTVLVCGHSNTVPEIMRSLGITEPIAIDENTYDRLFIVTLQGNRISLQRLRYGP